MTKIIIDGFNIRVELEGTVIENVEAVEVTRGILEQPIVTLRVIPDEMNSQEEKE